MRDRARIVRLSLSEFRTYKALDITSNDGLIAFIGPNGAGKTNILEALSLLAPGRGLRGAELAECGRLPVHATEAGLWAVSAILANDGDEIRLATGLAAGDEPGRERRIVRIDGTTVKSANTFPDYLRVLWLTPAMDRLFVEAPGGRRRFLDRLVLIVDPSHAARCSAYERAMRERTRLLRDGRGDGAWLSGLERQMAEHGVAIAAARVDLVARLAQAMATRKTAFPQARLSIAGETERHLQQLSAIEAEDVLAKALYDGRARDAEAGRALSGPHRSDLDVEDRAKGRPASQCSTGEQKALLIAIVLAATSLQERMDGGRTPILLLDEIAAHLDAGRRAALFQEIEALGAQAWMTGTDAHLFEALARDAALFRVDPGRVERCGELASRSRA
ncbi:MAG: DNA replication/repair protein RecF [Alphaproteobacteria bacterium]|nr:DNA replication/repair protein RecF [Alphaproteobacteria bacterium]